MAMSKPQPVSVVLVASASAAFHGAAAVLFVPILSFLLLCSGRAPGNIEVVSTETAMVFALLSPVIATVFGFIAGAAMAAAHNMFAHGQRKQTIELAEARAMRATASLSNAA